MSTPTLRETSDPDTSSISTGTSFRPETSLYERRAGSRPMQVAMTYTEEHEVWSGFHGGRLPVGVDRVRPRLWIHRP